VATDKSPSDYRYVSKRLVTEIVQEHEAAGPRTKTSYQVGWKALSRTRERRDPDYANPFELARRATENVKESTGTVAYPGTYVCDEIDIAAGSLTVLLGWEEASHVKIAAMMGRHEDETAGHVLLALFGSMSNYSGRQPEAKVLPEIPSDVASLYVIIDRSSEPRDPSVERYRVEDESEINPRSRADSVIRLLDHRFKGFRRERLEVLMKVFYVVDDYWYFREEHFDRVLIGAPVWARTPLPKPLSTTGQPEH